MSPSSSRQEPSQARNTLVVVEHNLDAIKSADWVIALGHEGRAAGKQIIANVRREQAVNIEASHARHFLAKVPPHHGKHRSGT
ncbi:MAG: hypothetical protein IPM58_18280 [Nitrospira sp.]|nr:hypothetical protein [Nitrospira sp.]